jgi:DNA polymerase III subunit delta
MTPEQFLSSLRGKHPEPVYLFLGPEAYTRERCRRALLETVLPSAEARENGFTRHDLDEVTVAEVIDDARAMSLFAADRVILAGSAEAALPRGDASAAQPPELAAYLENPTPGVVLVFDCSRYAFDGDDKAKVQRVQKFYGVVRSVVEFPSLDVAAARRLAGNIAKQGGLRIGEDELDLLVDVLDADATRLAVELEKLATYAGKDRPITGDDIWSLVPNARATTIFSLVASVGRGDRAGSLDALDMLTRDGEYLPLALTFLGTQFRLALAARESGLTNAGQIQAHFARQGIQIWRGRAEQVAETLRAFPVDKLRRGLAKIYATDKALRDTRPDDRTVMEQFILSLT